jgi:hypothetical protein
MRGISRDLRAAAPAMRRRLRTNITAAMKPMQQEAQRNAFNIPVKGPKSTGLRVAIMRATKIQINTGARVVRVRLKTDGKAMPEGQQSLATLMEGSNGLKSLKWRHPVYGPHDSKTWVGQSSHPYFAPAVLHNLPGVDRAVDAALKQTADDLAKGGR